MIISLKSCKIFQAQFRTIVRLVLRIPSHVLTHMRTGQSKDGRCLNGNLTLDHKMFYCFFRIASPLRKQCLFFTPPQYSPISHYQCLSENNPTNSRPCPGACIRLIMSIIRHLRNSLWMSIILSIMWNILLARRHLIQQPYVQFRVFTCDLERYSVSIHSSINND